MPGSSHRVPTTVASGDAVRHWLFPLAIAALAWCAVVATLDSNGAVPWLGEGPGLTLDETFNVQMGVYHVRAVREYGLAILSWESIQEIFGANVYNPDHPPLGRVLIGIAHDASWPILKPDVPANSVAVTCGRVASAFGFAATIFLVGWMTSRWHGHLAGVIAATSLLLMPRLFAHAHLAALETLVGLAYVATVFHVADRWTIGQAPALKTAGVSGVLLGLTLLTKIQGILLPIPIAIWALWNWRFKSIAPLAVFGIVGFLVFFLGWPWLWLAPVAHVGEYLGRTTDRLTLYCWYLGQKWADTDVPWHYPLVMFLVTVPLGLHLLGLCGLLGRDQKQPNEAPPPAVNKHSQPSTLNSQLSNLHFAIRNLQFAFPPLPASQVLIALNVVWPLIFFALPGITVYDGARLFLMVFPLWAVFIGRGGALASNYLANWRTPRFATASLAILLMLQSYGAIVLHPVQLSYYNLLVGGLRGASRLGFEVTYWGDSVTRSFLQDVQRENAEEPVYFAPVLHPFQLQELRSQTPAWVAPLVPFDEAYAENMRRLIVFRRRADSWPSLNPSPPHSRLHAVVEREGVPLAEYYVVEPEFVAPNR